MKFITNDIWTIGHFRLVEFVSPTNNSSLWLINLSLPLAHSEHATFICDYFGDEQL